ncbi:MAG: isoleucine--tRNA ligase [Bdellovibrionaceae bacterium]|nr:isoleucine--tRNA ligase [Pseudobdellovibrionaceae bacterium]|tara:strand:+ start:13492 stop:16641 length:3150 start_codon:yes stop_codon:yes gene_type:complete
MTPQSVYRPVSPQVQLPQNEESVLSFWEKEQVFQKTLEQTKDAPFYSFYDGPPFATGLPHYGHILAGLLKDIVPRYWTMRGFHVPRRFGWDCHGVPVEYEINKQMNVTSSAQVREEIGVARYNEACRSIVDRYTNEWKKTVKRVGRWVDMENGYQTMDLSFMQSVWWVFKELWDKGLIYEGYKVVPYSIGISTPLSNFEASQNYKMVQDPAITARFKVRGEENTYFLAWTTTPWTLPSNLGLAVGNEINYVKVKDENENFYYLAEALLNSYSKELGKEPQIVETLKGASLVGKTYEPLFSYFKDEEKNGAFQIIHSDHVTTEAGTGIVHMAPAFGEEDFYACQKAGLPLVNPVDDDGRFTNEVPDYQGVMVKDADKKIISALKDSKKLFRQETINHSYPHCERTDTPLIYKAVSSWFVSVEKIKKTMIEANQKTSWVPESLRDGRFGKWLENARDWAISRNRFWGTPLPIWRNDEGEVVCISSAKELSTLSGREVKDLHIHFVDEIEIPSPTGKSPLRRVSGVLDCWFESGSMPLAQWGYPYQEENVVRFKNGFPADFIAEGLDQTRGWFYTLTVIGSALFGQSPFKNVIVNGIILAEDGRKMSKRLKNYPDPLEVINRYGADALRLYLIDSPVVKAQDMRFTESGVEDVVRRILLRWWNSYSFYVSYANIDKFVPKGDAEESPNILDQWILSRLNTLILNTNTEMEHYRLYNVVPQLLHFIEELTNTYIRFNRKHFWQEGMPEDKRFAFETLYQVLLQLSRVMAPFTPFISEEIFQNLRTVRSDLAVSVHLEKFPFGEKERSKPQLEKSVQVMADLCLMGRNLREKLKIKSKIPLKSLKVIMRDASSLAELKKLEPYFVGELNVREVIYESNEDQYVDISGKANFKKLGQRLGKKMKAVAAEIAQLSLEDLLKLESGETLVLAGESITLEDIEIRRASKEKKDHFLTTKEMSIELDPTVDSDQIQEGLAREVVRRVQMARKNADFNLDDRIDLSLVCDSELKSAVESYESYVCGETLARSLQYQSLSTPEYQETFDVDGASLEVCLSR